VTASLKVGDSDGAHDLIIDGKGIIYAQVAQSVVAVQGGVAATVVPASSFSTPAVTIDGGLYTGVSTSGFGVFDEYVGSTAQWSLPVQLNQQSSVALASDGGALIVGGSSGSSAGLWSISPTGKVEWSADLQTQTESDGFPAVGADGSVYVGVVEGLRAFSSDGSPEWSLVYKNGASRPVVARDGTIYFVGYADTDTGLLVAVNPAGSVLLEKEVGPFFLGALTIAPGGDVIASGTQSPTGLMGGRVQRFDPQGNLRWQFIVPSDHVSEPVLDRCGNVLIGLTFLYSLSATGDVSWELPELGACGAPVLIDEGKLVVWCGDTLYWISS
jgi:hypothetical protein